MLLSWRTTLFISHPFSLFYSILNQDASVVTRVRNRIDNLLFEKLLYLPILKQSENLSSLISHSAFFLSKNLIIPTRVKSITIQFSNSSWNWNEKCLKDTFARIVYHYFFEKLYIPIEFQNRGTEKFQPPYDRANSPVIYFIRSM